MEIFFELDDIESTAKDFLKMANGYQVFGFSGELGAGKTTFISALCDELQVAETVSSPTFSIIQEYKTKTSKIIYHIDLYRIKNKEEAMDAGIEDCLNSNEICFVEWPEKAPEIFPPDTVFTNIVTISPTSRKLMVTFPA
ncbi:MAG: tRNA (adenosine(37)-N6)-threonylcarbamoyltransferase complex ATPase subunit type 1 TsaE [Ginsengibacter sp.]